MVGDQGAAGTAAAALTGQVRSAYEAAQQDWAAGPQQVYAALATALLAQAAPWVTGQQVLDAGAGTGLAAAAALDLGARRVVAADLAPGLLRQAGPRLHPVAASIYALPFRNGSFGLVAAAFSLSHLSDLSAGLAGDHRQGRTNHDNQQQAAHGTSLHRA